MWIAFAAMQLIGANAWGGCLYDHLATHENYERLFTRNPLILLTFDEMVKFFTPIWPPGTPNKKLDRMVTHYLTHNKDPLRIARELIASIPNKSSEDVFEVRSALLEKMRTLSPEHQAVRELTQALLSVQDQVEASPHPTDISEHRLLGWKLLGDPKVPAKFKADYIYAQMGSGVWEGERIFQGVTPQQKAEVKALLYKRLPLMPVLEEMARRHKILDFPIDLALAESLRFLPIPGESNLLSETHVTELFYSVRGELPSEFDPGEHIEAGRQGLTLPVAPFTSQPVSVQRLRRRANFPVVASREDGEIFAREFTQIAHDLGLKGHLGIPSDPQMDRAIRAGTTTNYFWGNDIYEVFHFAHFWGDGGVYGPRKVGQGFPNAAGFKDPVGNMWVPTSTDGVSRGGSWMNDTHWVQSSARIYRGSQRSSSDGLRFIWTVP